jgi:hypothetical protein
MLGAPSCRVTGGAAVDQRRKMAEALTLDSVCRLKFACENNAGWLEFPNFLAPVKNADGNFGQSME